MPTDERKELSVLIRKAQNGDQEAMEQVLRWSHTSVSYKCRKILKNPQDAEDMTQEVLLQVYAKLGTLENPDAFPGWLKTLTDRRCFNALRGRHVELQPAEDEDGHSILDDLEELDEQQIPDKALDNAETTRMIEELVSELPEAQRLCVLMYYYDELSVKEIAEITEVSENTVKSRLNYARKAIKERVLDYEEQGVKLYGLSPLPFLLFFLRRAAEDGADSAAAQSMAKQVMSLGAASAGGAAAGTGAAAHLLGSVSAKLIAGVLAGVLVVGGGIGLYAVTHSENEPTDAPNTVVTPAPVNTDVYADKVLELSEILGEDARYGLVYVDGDATPELVVSYINDGWDSIDLYTLLPDGTLVTATAGMTSGRLGPPMYYPGKNVVVLAYTYAEGADETYYGLDANGVMTERGATHSDNPWGLDMDDETTPEDPEGLKGLERPLLCGDMTAQEILELLKGSVPVPAANE